MSLAAPAVYAEPPTSDAEASTPSRALRAARVGWVALAALVLILNAIAIPNTLATLQSVCHSAATCLSMQLTPMDLRLLRQYGLSPSFLAAYQVAWDAGTTLIYTALATLIFLRRSNDRMAMFCAYMLVLTGGASYTSLLDDGLRTLAPAWKWPVGVLQLMGLSSLLIFFLVFPRGQFIPRWTRWWALIAVLAEWHYVFITDPLRSKDNGPADFLAFVFLVVSLIALQVYRYRRVSTFRERQQTKWALLGFSVALLGFIVSFTLAHFFPPDIVQTTVFQVLVINTLSEGFLLLIPISIAMAILRTRLYDIDTLINKALVYGVLTGLLGALYIGLIVGLEGLFGQASGQLEQQPVALVFSTLAVASLFHPLRRRIQSFIDRRFYRRKYDAEKTLAAFSAMLRSEVNLEQICEQTLTLVDETLRPASSSLWLLAPEQTRRPSEPKEV
ncbi:MAG TPA: hypothetical protein VFN78_06090 [Ktedonobacterales bacterium]|nr:hypothetical protein [Ktedonobacterales bacterium]